MLSALVLASLAALVLFILVTSKDSEHFVKKGRNAEATYHYYKNNDGSGSGACETACADVFCTRGKEKSQWKRKLADKNLPWTAVNMKTLRFPNQDGAKFRSSGVCGSVVTIKKGRKQKKFRIVDMKGGPGFDLAGKAFRDMGLNYNAGKDKVEWSIGR